MANGDINDTGLNCYNYAGYAGHDREYPGRRIDYDATNDQWFIVYEETETSQQNQPKLMLGWGNGTSWSSVQLCDWDDTSGSGLLMDGVAGSGDCYAYVAALAVDNVANELHVAYGIQNTSSGFFIYHSKLNDLTAPGSPTNWEDYGSSQYYQRVDNGGGGAYYPDVDMDEATNRLYIVWRDTGAGIMVNSGTSSTHTITASNETVIDSDTNNAYPSLVSVWGGTSSADAVYVSWLNTTSNYQIEVKRCQTASSGWSTAGNWKGPASGTTTPDVKIGNWSDADGLVNGGITAFYNDTPHEEQVFICALLTYTGGPTTRVYDNWFDEDSFGPTGWNTTDGSYTTETPDSAWSDGMLSCSSLREDQEGGSTEDFRIVASVDTTDDGYPDSAYFSDTDSGSASYTHSSSWSQVPDATGDSDPSRGNISAERHASDKTNSYVSYVSIDIEKLFLSGYTSDIYYVETDKPTEQFQSAVLGVGASYTPSLELETHLECSMGVGSDFTFDDFNIYCVMGVGVSLALKFQVPLDCDLAVTCDESAAPENTGQVASETEPDTLDWTVVC